MTGDASRVVWTRHRGVLDRAPRICRAVTLLQPVAPPSLVRQRRNRADFADVAYG
ncbi:hypothetical protein [Streptomyces luteogriseus]|uniref:hypothetical protein n=1 Tax=Streptomyces luteogriseus TaxID=68233 RepID=UPI003810E40C